jgi:hypothetical protein
MAEISDILESWRITIGAGLAEHYTVKRGQIKNSLMSPRGN